MAFQVLNFIYTILSWGLYAYMIAMAVYVLMTWLPGALDSGFGQVLGKIVEPFLGWFQRFIPALAGIDFSPILAFAVLAIARRAVDYLYWALVPRLVAG